MKLPRNLGASELIKALTRFGYSAVRQTGSHIRLQTQHPVLSAAVRTDTPEQAFAENVYTLRGQAVHSRVEVRAGLRIERALPIWSEKLGLIGKADIVEFEPDGRP